MGDLDRVERLNTRWKFVGVSERANDQRVITVLHTLKARSAHAALPVPKHTGDLREASAHLDTCGRATAHERETRHC